MTTEQDNNFLDPKELFRLLDEVCLTAKPLEPLWGYFLFKKAITSIIGDPGVCKSTFGYGMSIDLCQGRPFLDITPEEPVKSLILDFESSDSLVASRKALITEGDTPNVYIYNIVDYYLPQIASVAVQFCKDNGINLLVIDNQTMAFNTHDENDNSEAAKQMRFIRTIVNAINSACILFHHTSKANLPGTRKGTGAFARARLADICVNIDIADENVPDIIRLETVKNRLVDDKVLWYLKKESGKFIYTEPPLGAIGKPTDNTIIYQVQQAILGLLDGTAMLKRKEVVDALSFEEWAVLRGLDRLKQLGRIHCPQYGYYKRK